MFAAIPALSGQRTALLSGNLKYTSPLLTHTRASAAYGVVDSNLTGFAPNVARFVDAPGGGYGLLSEGIDKNETINARAEASIAGVVGSGGRLPTDFALFATSGLSVQIVGSVTVQGVPGFILRLFGTSTTGYAVFVSRFNSGSGIPTTGGQPWTSSAYFQRISGTWTGVAANVGYREIGGLNAVPGADFAATNALQRQFVTGTTTAGTTAILPAFGLNFPTATALDFTFFYGGFDCKNSSALTSVALPLPGTPAATTRAADSTTALLSALGIAVSGRGTYLIDAVLGAGTLMSLDDGTQANRVTLYTSGNQMLVRRDAASATALSTGLAGATVGAQLKMAITVDGAGGAAACIAGGADTTVAGCPTSLTTLRLGNDITTAAALNGLLCNATYYPAVMSAAQRQALTA